jgi:hypothetical protein
MLERMLKKPSERFLSVKKPLPPIVIKQAEQPGLGLPLSLLYLLC